MVDEDQTVPTDTLRRIELSFDRLDTDHNGYIEFADYDNTVDNLCMAAGVNTNSPKSKKVRAGYYSLFNRIAELLDTDHDGRISKDAYLDFDKIQSIWDDNEDNASLVTAIFELFDQDGDGKISLGEFDKMVAAIHGIPRDEYKEIFRSYDTDNSGDLSLDETHKVIADLVAK